MAVDPAADGSGGWLAPDLNWGMRFSDYGSYGLRQFGGWVREEYLPELTGRNGARVYREMLDGSATVGSMIFAVQQAMRGVRWRVEPANDSPEAQKEAEFVDSLRDDMSHTWDSFITEALSMLGYGYSIHEIVYKRRLGQKPEARANGGAIVDENPSSKYDDGRIGWRRLPIRSQDVVLKWFFDANGQIRGVTQQPWTGTLIDIPIEKMLLFRASQHKNNPEGRSVLRNAYRPYYFTKRLEEMEAILIERMSGVPVLYIPTSLLDAAAPPAAGQPANPQQSLAMQTLQGYKNMVTGVRVNEQMGMLLPSDPFTDADGKKTNMRMYEFQLVVPQRARGGAETDKIIMRHKVDTLMTLICDFLMMGHEVRGTNNLSITRVDMFYSAIEGWLSSIGDVLNRYGLPRLWEMNGLDPDLMPKILPDMPQRLDLDSLGAFIKNLAASGMPLFPDDELQQFIREAAGFPLIDPEDEDKPQPKSLQEQQAEFTAQSRAMSNGGTDTVKRMLLGAMAKKIVKMRKNGNGQT
jgi:hypothetical protein